MHRNKPLITIVTVCYNAAEAILPTVKSVLAQDYPHIEYIIIDGKSQDDTLELLKPFESKIDLVVSEPDEGVYDAMNKGIRLAKGEYINFMNAGDYFYEDNSLSKAFEKAPENADLIYGHYEVRYSTYSEVIPVQSLTTPWTGMKFCHQSLLLRTSLAREVPFSGKYITSDFEQIYDLFQRGTVFFDTDTVIASFLHDGLNTKHKLRIRYESREIVQKLGGMNPETKTAFRKLIFRTKIIETARSLLPDSLFEFLMKTKNRITGKSRVSKQKVK